MILAAWVHPTVENNSVCVLPTLLSTPVLGPLQILGALQLGPFVVVPLRVSPSPFQTTEPDSESGTVTLFAWSVRTFRTVPKPCPLRSELPTSVKLACARVGSSPTITAIPERILRVYIIFLLRACHPLRKPPVNFRQHREYT